MGNIGFHALLAWVISITMFLQLFECGDAAKRDTRDKMTHEDTAMIEADFLIANEAAELDYAVFEGSTELCVHRSGGWLGEVVGETRFGTRSRKTDPSTGRYVVPRSLRPHIGANGLVTGTSLDPAELSLRELRGVMRSHVESPEGGVCSDWDPLDDTRRFDVAGNLCYCEVSATCDCHMVQHDLFHDYPARSTAYTDDYYAAPLRPFAGEDDYEGDVREVVLEEEVVDGFDRPLLVNDVGLVAGQPRFRLTDDEVDDVFYLEARKRRGFEVIPGRIMEVWGWRGGKVEDFEFDADGFLSGGFIVVGPHPHTDVNDRVVFGEKRHGPFGYGFTKHDAEALGGVWLEDDSPFSDLEVRTPGPEMRFTDGRRTRIYVVNRMEDDHEEKISVHWHGMDLPHDMDGVPFETQTPIHVNTTWTYEYQIPNIGSRWYHQHFNTHITLGMGMFGPVSTEYPDEIKTWDREYVTQVADVQSRFTMNGNSFPGTIERLSGHFKDQMEIAYSVRADDGSGDMLVVIKNAPREALSFDIMHVPQANPDPAHGGPIRAGTGGVSQSDGAHTNQGHNIPNRIQGRRVQILGHVEEGLVYPKATLNGYHYVTKEGSDEPAVLLRVPRVGLEGSPGGVGGTLYVWRKHKSSADRPMLQNNGNSGAHYKLNYGEEVAMRWFNAARDPHPLHIHGHQWNIFALDGNLLDSPVVHNVFLIPQAATFDARVNCNNPNRFGGWMLHCHNLNHLSNPDNPWPGGEEYPGGMLSHLDYTGEDRMRGVVSHEFHTQPFNELPPSCEASPRSLEVGRDVLGQAARQGHTFIRLDVEVDYGEDTRTGMPFGNITGFDWALKTFEAAGNGSHPAGEMMAVEGGGGKGREGGVEVEEAGGGGGLPTIWGSQLQSPRVTGFEEDGEYTFEIRVEGENAEREREEDVTTCVDELVVTVGGPDDDAGGGGVVDDSGDDRIATHGSALNVRLEAGSDGGFITQPLFKARVEPPLVVMVTGAPGVTVNDSGVEVEVDVNGEFDRVEVLGDVPVYVRDDIKVARVMRDPKIKTHGVPVAVDLEAGADIGTITLRLFRGTLMPLGRSAQTMYFTVTDASDAHLAQLLGAVYAPQLANVALEACETDSDFDMSSNSNSAFVFRNHPGSVGSDLGVGGTPRGISSSGGVASQGPRGNSEYSPLKRFMFEGRNVTVNAPLIVWGPGVDERLVSDRGGCDDRIRSIPPSELWEGGGPPGCAEEDGPLDRFQGGQVVNVDTGAMEVTVKLHRAVLHNDGVFPYYSVFEASSPSAAGYLGVVHAPKLGRVLAGSPDPVLPSMMHFGNGRRGNGALGFQPSIASHTGASDGYLPLTHSTWLLYNCGEIPGVKWPMSRVIGWDQSEWAEGRNVVQGDVPSRGVEGFDRYGDEGNFDPYQMAGGVKGYECPGFVESLTGSGDVLSEMMEMVLEQEGVLFADEVEALITARDLFHTEDPLGSELGVGEALVMNHPMLVSVDMNEKVPAEGVFDSELTTYEWVIVRTKRGLQVDAATDVDRVLFACMGCGGGGEGELDPPVFGWSVVKPVTEGGGVSHTVGGGDIETLEVKLGRVEGPSKYVYIGVTDASDEEFADKFGAVFAPALGRAPVEAVEFATFAGDLETFHFSTNRSVDLILSYDAGLVAAGGNPPLGNPKYSPLKRFLYDGKMITLNAPMIVWGEEPGQRVLIDQGGCDPNIRILHPSPNWLGGGPAGCTEEEHFLGRYKGGQALRIDLEAMEMTVKLHRAVLRGTDILPYYTVFEASAPPAAGFMGVPHAPKLSKLGRGVDTTTQGGLTTRRKTTAVDTLRQFGNGVSHPAGGPNRFQPGVVPFAGGDVQMYTPMWHITWLVFNCGGGVDGTEEVGDVIPLGEDIWFPGRNVAQGDMPGLGLDGFDPSLIDFDPAQLAGGLKGAVCPEYARNVTGNSDGSVFLLDWVALKEQGLMFETDAPLGAELGNGVIPPLIVNCPLPVTVKMSGWTESVVTDGCTCGGATREEGEARIVGGASIDTWSMDGMHLSPGSEAAFQSGALVNIDVRVGQLLTFEVDSSVGHGLVLFPMDAVPGDDVEALVREVIEVDETASQRTSTTALQSFVNMFGEKPWGVMNSIAGPAVLLTGRIRPGVVGRRMTFGCFVHSPGGKMLGTITVVGG